MEKQALKHRITVAAGRAGGPAHRQLPVIPMLKITDTGLFDVNTFRNVPVEAGNTDLSSCDKSVFKGLGVRI